MDKIAVGAGLPPGVVDLDAAGRGKPAQPSRGCQEDRDVGELVLCTLDRDRHAEMIAKAREAGARIMLIGDGDVSGVIMAAQMDSGVDIFVGSGGAPEGVLAAAALALPGGPDAGPA